MAAQLTACVPVTVWAGAALGVGRRPVSLTGFPSGAFCVSRPRFAVGGPPIWLKAQEGRGQKSHFCCFDSGLRRLS